LQSVTLNGRGDTRGNQMPNDGALEKKVILVTGAGGGIGAAIAKLAAKEGARVVVNDLGCDPGGVGGAEDPARTVVEEITAAGGEAVASFGSVASWDSARAVVDGAVSAFGRIDGVVNNAGVLRDALFHKMSQADWQTSQDINLAGAFYIARAAAPHFRAQQSGAFVHMTSSSGLIGNLGQVNYAAAKMGLVGLSKCIALDMSRFNVRSNCIAPFAYTRLIGEIKTDTEENRKRVEALKLMKPEQIAPFVVSLLSDGASDVTGQIFGVRRNEIILFSQPRPVRTVHSKEGWTPSSCLATALPALRASMYPLQISSEVFVWDPI
jgi:NAD(P)-dependent dehydrogenase (short-subunit alcohol dehydrogenase family)